MTRDEWDLQINTVFVQLYKVRIGQKPYCRFNTADLTTLGISLTIRLDWAVTKNNNN